MGGEYQFLPYFDKAAGRWKAPGCFVDSNGNKHNVMGSGPTQRHATQAKDRRLLEVEKSLGLALIPAGKLQIADYCAHWLEEIKIPTGALTCLVKTLFTYFQ